MRVTNSFQLAGASPCTSTDVLRTNRAWVCLDRHPSDCYCGQCVPDQAKIVKGWPAEYYDRWFGLQFRLPPQRGFGSWYSIEWSWKNERFYLRGTISAAR